jgi:surface protein
MALALGNILLLKLYKGTVQLTKLYLGSNVIFPAPTNITDFVTTWRTTGANETITIPTNGSGFNYDIHTSDGQTFTGVTGNQAITFATAGDYDVNISGLFPYFYLNNNSDKLKLIDVKQWGNIVWDSFNLSFFGASNLIGTFTDVPNLTSVSDMFGAFAGDSLFNGNISNWNVSNVTNMEAMFFEALQFNSDVSNWDVSNVTNMFEMFNGDTSFNQDISLWNVSNVTNMGSIFNGATSFNQNLEDWDIVDVTVFTNFLAGVTLSTANYNALLIGWNNTLNAAYPVSTIGYPTNISFSAGNSTYTGGIGSAASNARTNLITKFSWTITDGGTA